MKTKYVLVTPVYNEEDLIERVIKSVVTQTILPQKWIIVNDGSTDGTAQIIKRYEAEHDFITSIRLKREDIESYYSRRVWVVLAGIEAAREFDCDFLGVQDADITCGPTYYERLLEEFDRNPRLGVAAGIYFYDSNGRMEKVLLDELCTPGSNQIFRKKCYEEIGGYVPLRYGGDDSLMDILARMHGWETQNFKDYPVVQHRSVGTGDKRSILQARFRQGLTEYGIATHPLFMFFKQFRRAFLEKPYFIGSLARLAGFLYGYWLREERKIPREAIRFVRKEQLGRLLIGRKKKSSSVK